MKKWLAILPVMVLCSMARADADALNGINTVRVVVEVSPELKRADPALSDHVEADACIGIRNTGARVVEDSPENAAVPVLSISITGQVRNGLVSYFYSVRLRQLAKTTLTGTLTEATTWENTGGGMGMERQVTLIRGFVGDTVEQFINKLQSANQR